MLSVVIWATAFVVIVTIALDNCGWIPFQDSCTDSADSDTLIVVTLISAVVANVVALVWSVRKARRAP